jgi:predicted component of type VI protein secretion system
MALLRITKGVPAGKATEIGDDAVTVGRAAANTICVQDPAISGRHFGVRREGKRVTLKDLGSTNGTYLNGKPVTESALKAGDVIAVGEIEFTLEGDDIEAPEPAAAQPEPARDTVPLPRPASSAASVPPTIQGPSPFGARKDFKWMWVTGLTVAGLLVLAALFWFLARLFQSGS